MRFLLAAGAAAVLLAGPAFAGGDWEDYDDREYSDREYRDEGYYVGPPEYYAGFYPPRWAAPIYAPRGDYPYRRSYPAYVDGPYARRGYAYESDGECVIKRKWRRGRYIEKIDCDD